ncbi:MAG: hypothetical protein ACXV7C_01200 [Candidatus Angelobacter sp.]
MSARHDKLLFVLLIVLVTLLFFIPVPSGGFQAQNGPTTPVDNLNLRVALAGLMILLAANIAVSRWLSLNSMAVHFPPVFLYSPAASSIGISLRC